MLFEERVEEGIWWVRFATRHCTINHALVLALLERLEERAGDEAVRALVLAGKGGRFFSPGFNLPEVAGYDRTRMGRFARDFSRLYRLLFAFPRPTVALLDGHAIAAGCILASCCDFRFGRPGILLGMTEMSLSVAIPWGSVRIIEQLIGYGRFREVAYLGRNYAAEEALAMGWIDALWPAEELIARTRARALELAGQSPQAFRLQKESFKGGLARELEEQEEERLEAFLQCWFSPAAQERIRRQVEKLTAN